MLPIIKKLKPGVFRAFFVLKNFNPFRNFALTTSIEVASNQQPYMNYEQFTQI